MNDFVGIPQALSPFIIIIMLQVVAYADGSKVPPPKGEQCVEDPVWMRAHHFEIILHQRDETVIRGIRTKKHSLKNCIDCHITPNAKGEYARYSNNEEHFCAGCHEYAAVKIDCFQCHADRPEAAVRESIKQHSQGSKDPHHSMQMNTDGLGLDMKLLSAQ